MFDGRRDDEGTVGRGKITGRNPTDRGKQGVKRSVLVEAKGIPLAVAVDGANRHDMKLVKATLEGIEIKRPKPTKRKPQGLCLDKGYDYEEVRDLVEEFKFTAHVRSRGEEAKAIKRDAGFKARRWVVMVLLPILTTNRFNDGNRTPSTSEFHPFCTLILRFSTRSFRPLRNRVRAT